jgi:NADH-quinone oxidoreductase subunit M
MSIYVIDLIKNQYSGAKVVECVLESFVSYDFMLALLVSLPLLGVAVTSLWAISEKEKTETPVILSMYTSIIVFIVSLQILGRFNKSSPRFQATLTKEAYANVEDLNSYIFGLDSSKNLNLAVDGISICFVVLTCFIIVVCLMSSFSLGKTKNLVYMNTFLVLDSLLVLSFTTTDLLQFYVFFEIILLPMLFIILFFGSRARKIKASYYFFFYTIVGSFFMLVGILLVYIYTGSTSFFIILNIELPLEVQKKLWLLFFIGFAVKIPMFPFHIWLPEAHVEAPTEGSVILASLLLKLGGYGFLRFSLTMFPLASYYYAPLVYVTCAIGVIYASLTTLRQVDLKKIVAYSSVAHMNFAVLGIFSFTIEGIQGSIMLMLSHGLVSGALFFLIGILYKRYHSRFVFYYGGLVQVMPLFSFFFLFFILANLSFPGTFSFVGELLITVGLFQANTFVAFLTVICVMVLTAAYSIYLFTRICFGALKTEFLVEPTRGFSCNNGDLTTEELQIFVPLCLFTILFGIFPDMVLDISYVTIKYLLISINKSL